MSQLLGLFLLSFFITSILVVPFIDLLYRWKMREKKDKHLVNSLAQKTPILYKLSQGKEGTPYGGGAIVVLATVILTLWAIGLLNLEVKPKEIFILLFTFISFALLGAYDDIKKIFDVKDKVFFGLRMRHKFIIQWFLGFFIGAYFYFVLQYDFLYIHWLGMIPIGVLFIPLTAFMVVAFANAFNITSGLDGLAPGLLMICLTSFLVLATNLMDQSLVVFIAIWLGSLLAFLYFNVFPARVFPGDVSELAFGATLAVIGLLTGKIIALMVIGGVIIAEGGSSLIQLLSKRFRGGQKFFEVAPLHLWFRLKGWEEPKVVNRFWLAGILCAVFGLWLAVIK